MSRSLWVAALALTACSIDTTGIPCTADGECASTDVCSAGFCVPGPRAAGGGAGGGIATGGGVAGGGVAGGSSAGGGTAGGGSAGGGTSAGITLWELVGVGTSRQIRQGASQAAVVAFAVDAGLVSAIAMPGGVAISSNGRTDAGMLLRLVADHAALPGPRSITFQLDDTSLVVLPDAVTVTYINVALSGSDTARGTADDPLRTITHATQVARPDGGSTVLISAGDYTADAGETWPIFAGGFNLLGDLGGGTHLVGHGDAPSLVVSLVNAQAEHLDVRDFRGPLLVQVATGGTLRDTRITSDGGTCVGLLGYSHLDTLDLRGCDVGIIAGGFSGSHDARAITVSDSRLGIGVFTSALYVEGLVVSNVDEGALVGSFPLWVDGGFLEGYRIGLTGGYAFTELADVRFEGGAGATDGVVVNGPQLHFSGGIIRGNVNGIRSDPGLAAPWFSGARIEGNTIGVLVEDGGCLIRNTVITGNGTGVTLRRRGTVDLGRLGFDGGNTVAGNTTCQLVDERGSGSPDVTSKATLFGATLGSATFPDAGTYTNSACPLWRMQNGNRLVVY